MQQKSVNRRTFLKQSLALSALPIIPAFVAPRTAAARGDMQLPPSERINLAVVGCGARGGAIGNQAMSSGLTTTIALCDVNLRNIGRLKKKAPKAEEFQDFRKMFDKLGDKIDGCTIGVPDHAHFPIAMLAMSKGIGMYIEKPLAHTFQECELLMQAEKKYKVPCQMGNQGHSGANYFQFKAWVDAGIIKNVRKVDAFMNKGRRWHPWGNVKGYPEGVPTPDYIDWDIWTGTAPYHPYDKKLDGGNWRGWYDYGNGAFGDWGPHTLDTIHRFLKLGLPYEVRADKLEGPNDYIYPMATTIAFEFASRGENMPKMSINWYDGVKNRPPYPKELKDGKGLGGCGKVMYSDDFIFKGGTHSATLSIISKHGKDDIDFPKIPGGNSNHMDNFLLSVLGREKCRSSFDVSGPLTQIFMLGCIAQRLGGTLAFDTKKKQITNNKRANQLLTGHQPRKGWEEFYKL